MYSQRLTLRVGLAEPKTYIAMAAVKQYIGNCRTHINVGSMIRTIEELIIIMTGIAKHSLEVTNNEKYQLIEWIDLIAQYLQERNLQIINRVYDKEPITMNKAIIDYAIEYTRTTKQQKDKVGKINKV